VRYPKVHVILEVILLIKLLTIYLILGTFEVANISCEQTTSVHKALVSLTPENHELKNLLPHEPNRHHPVIIPIQFGRILQLQRLPAPVCAGRVEAEEAFGCWGGGRVLVGAAAKPV